MSPGKTLSEKIFSQKAGRDVKPGEFLLLKVDLALASEITGQVAIEEFRNFGGKRVYAPDQVCLVPDHFTPNMDIKSAEQAKMVREFAREQKIEKYYEVGRMGIEHVLLPEQGIVKTGDLVIGADSHTCTYGALCAFSTGVGSTDIAGVYLTGKAWFKVPESIKVHITGQFQPYVSGKDLILKVISILGVSGANYRALEFSGPGIGNISMEARLTVSNMAIEAGGKTGLFPADAATIAYENEKGITVKPVHPDPDAVYAREIEICLDSLKAQVAYPYLPSNCKAIDQAEKDGIRIDQAVIGSCTNGRIEDLRMAAEILKNKKIHPDVRCLIFPGSQAVYKQAVQEGLAEIFIDAGCAFSTPTCGPCPGGHMGILAQGERAISTTNRNFVGRMGHPKSEIYLSSPSIAAASAVKGYISGVDSL